MALVPEPDRDVVRRVQLAEDPQSAERIDYFASDAQALPVTHLVYSAASSRIAWAANPSSAARPATTPAAAAAS